MRYGKTLVTPTDVVEAARTLDVRILDARWRLGAEPGEMRADYERAHIEGALFVDLEVDLVAHGLPAAAGRHPLPEREAFAETLRRLGIGHDTHVVVYDVNGSLSAARLWWMLRWAGKREAHVLDGGLDEWRRHGERIAEGPSPEVAPGDFELGEPLVRVLDEDAIARLATRGVVLDARALERYRGEVEPIDPVAGHIPGARPAPTTNNLAYDGRFVGPEQLRYQFEQLGARTDEPVGVYCGSGVTAAHEALALELAGFTPAVYPGSWSAWSNQERPVETGAYDESRRASAGR